MDQPAWMAEAWQQLGTREVPGSRHSRDVLDFFRDVGRRDVTKDEVPWCAAFVGACLERSGNHATGSLLARSFLDWGDELSAPRLGAVAVLTRGSDPSAGHVGFWIGDTKTEHILLGGNQSDAVTVSAFDKKRLLGFRWPHGRDGAQIETGGEGLTFRKALAHVLEMEGGFTDDPDDPGGPTNKGIILEVFCKHTGRRLDAVTRVLRVAELRAITDGTVEEIYRQRYWRPSEAGRMPAAIAFMHFDASVNHGLTGAARLLQQAVKRQASNLEIDGEIGPLTLAAVARADEAALLSDYAEARRAKYRSLRHFWKFGRGWLNRVEKTEAAAHRYVGRATAAHSNSQPATKGNDMSNIDTLQPTKWWASSMTIWGAVLTALTTVVPIIGPAIGVDVTPDVVRQAGEQVVAIIQAIGGLVGTLMTIYGRARATQFLERRQVQVNI